jgi:hypothetical protein
MTVTITPDYIYLGATIILLIIQVVQWRKYDLIKKEVHDLWNQIHILAISAGNTIQKLEKKIDEKQNR